MICLCPYRTLNEGFLAYAELRSVVKANLMLGYVKRHEQIMSTLSMAGIALTVADSY